MSTCLSSKKGIKARKPHRCCLCGEGIAIGELHNTRTGVSRGDGFWMMRMHAECELYEQSPVMRKQLHDWDWYEDIVEPAFSREEAHAHAKLNLP